MHRAIIYSCFKGTFVTLIKLAAGFVHINPFPSSPILPLLEDLNRVQAAGFLDGRYAVLLLVQHHGWELCRLPRGLRLRRHYWGSSRRHGRWSRRGSACRLRRNQFLRRVGWSSSIDHWSWKRRIHHFL